MILFILELSGVKLNENISFLRGAGYCKALITFVKYMPQVIRIPGLFS
jgi:cystinosin